MYMYVYLVHHKHSCIVPYKMIYWLGINIGDWHFYEEIANIKSAILFQSEHAQWHVAQNRFKIHQFLSTGKSAKYCSRQQIILYGITVKI